MQTSFTISAKKGDAQQTRWLIIQDIPYPDIHNAGGRFEWRNGGGLFSEYGRPAHGIGEQYICYLLADTAPAKIGDDFNRTVFAGFMEYKSVNMNGGTVKLRGKDLGEMSIRFEANPQWPVIRLNCTDNPSPVEREFIVQAITPRLLEFIQQNRAALYQNALERIEKRFSEQVAEARKAIDELEIKARAAVKLARAANP